MSEQWTLEKINQLITNQEQENLNLEYKSSGALEKTDKKREEITKDVSAMANSDGGTIIYGIKEYDETEKRYLPEKIDAIDQSKTTKEWLEQVITTIRPKIDGIIITPISLGIGNAAVYAVDIPKSDTAHQAQDSRYYKRFNFSSTPMQDYEIRDVMGRNKNPKLELSFKMSFNTKERIYTLFAKAENSGSVYAQYVNIFIEIPSYIVLGKKGYGDSPYLWQVENTVIDKIVGRKMDTINNSRETNDVTVSTTPPRYVPILPGLFREWELKLWDLGEVLPSGHFSENTKISWKIYADNAMPRIGEIFCNKIKIDWEASYA
jgi:hypothetical protein